MRGVARMVARQQHFNYSVSFLLLVLGFFIVFIQISGRINYTVRNEATCACIVGVIQLNREAREDKIYNKAREKKKIFRLLNL